MIKKNFAALLIMFFVFGVFTSNAIAADPPNSPVGYDNCGSDKLSTAIGCIPINNSTSMVTFLMNWALGIGGGVSFLLIVFAAFQIMTSGGDPKKLQGGKELMTSAIGGLILLIFSGFILRTLGFNVLGIF